MSTWDPPSDAELSAGKRFSYTIARRLRNMAQAFAEQTTGAPAMPPSPQSVVLFTTNTTWAVPSGVTKIFVEAWSGAGGGRSGLAGGQGEHRFDSFAVTPGETLNVEGGAGGAVGSEATNGDAGQWARIKRSGTTLIGAAPGTGASTIPGTAGSGGTGLQIAFLPVALGISDADGVSGAVRIRY
jgi:hypothetical protein